jgi:hypothetical protein
MRTGLVGEKRGSKGKEEKNSVTHRPLSRCSDVIKVRDAAVEKELPDSSTIAAAPRLTVRSPSRSRE